MKPQKPEPGKKGAICRKTPIAGGVKNHSFLWIFILINPLNLSSNWGVSLFLIFDALFWQIQGNQLHTPQVLGIARPVSRSAVDDPPTVGMTPIMSESQLAPSPWIPSKVVDPTDWVKGQLACCLWGQRLAHRLFMSLRCNRCGQEEPHLGDSWCLACSASEAIVGELRSAWGSAGSRSLASDLLVSATRQIRALRRLGIAGAGRGRPSVPEGAAPRASPKQPERSASRPPQAALPEPPPPPPRAAEKRAPVEDERVKREEVSREASDESEGEESEPRAEDEVVQAEASGLKAAPKSTARSSNRSEIPRRRTHERPEEEPERGADSHRASSHRESHRHRSRDRRERGDRERRDRSRSRRRRPHPPHEGKPRKRKKNRPGHRGGSKHQRLYRAADDPFKRFHYKKPEEFWDARPGLS